MAKCFSCKKWKREDLFRFDCDTFAALSNFEKLTCKHCEKDHKYLKVFSKLQYIDLKTERGFNAVMEYAKLKGANNAKLSLKRSKSKTVNIEKIKDIYITAVFCSFIYGKKFEVDHTIPINGRLVSGLHNPYNLQILDKVVNRAKTNMIVDETFINKIAIDVWYFKSLEARLKKREFPILNTETKLSELKLIKFNAPVMNKYKPKPQKIKPSWNDNRPAIIWR